MTASTRPSKMRTRFIGSLVFTTLLVTGCKDSAPPPPVLATVPAFALQDQDDKSFTLDDLAGKVWIATFIFTRCSGTCPRQTSVFYTFQEELHKRASWRDLRLVSMTVDPEYDTSAVMKKYAELTLADTTRWHFLTGDRTKLRELCKNGFKLAVFDQKENPDMPILHSDKIVLVDRQGRIRGYYDGLEEKEQERLRSELERVLAEIPAASAQQ